MRYAVPPGPLTVMPEPLTAVTRPLVRAGCTSTATAVTAPGPVKVPMTVMGSPTPTSVRAPPAGGWPGRATWNAVLPLVVIVSVVPSVRLAVIVEPCTADTVQPPRGPPLGGAKPGPPAGGANPGRGPAPAREPVAEDDVLV